MAKMKVFSNKIFQNWLLIFERDATSLYYPFGKMVINYIYIRGIDRAEYSQHRNCQENLQNAAAGSFSINLVGSVIL